MSKVISNSPTNHLRSNYQLTIRCQPDWDALSEILQARAQALGIDWQDNWKSNRLSIYYSLLLCGTVEHSAQHTQWTIRSAQPYSEKNIQEFSNDTTRLHVSFGIRKNIVQDSQFTGLELIWDTHGLFFPAWQHVPQQKIQTIPLSYLIQIMQEEYQGNFRFQVKHHVDVSQQFHSPENLQDWKLSRWRGDKSVHAITKLVRLELMVKQLNKK